MLWQSPPATTLYYSVPDILAPAAPVEEAVNGGDGVEGIKGAHPPEGLGGAHDGGEDICKDPENPLFLV